MITSACRRETLRGPRPAVAVLSFMAVTKSCLEARSVGTKPKRSVVITLSPRVNAKTTASGRVAKLARLAYGGGKAPKDTGVPETKARPQTRPNTQGTRHS